MNVVDEIKKAIEETREELNELVLTEKHETYYAVSQKLDTLIEEYLDAQALVVA